MPNKQNKTVVILDLDGTTIESGQLNMPLIATVKALRDKVLEQGGDFELKVLTSRSKDHLVQSSQMDFSWKTSVLFDNCKDQSAYLRAIDIAHQSLRCNTVSDIIATLGKLGLDITADNVIVGGDIWRKFVPMVNSEIDDSQIASQIAELDLKQHFETFQAFETLLHDEIFKSLSQLAVEDHYSNVVPVYQFLCKNNDLNISKYVKNKFNDLTVNNLFKGLYADYISFMNTDEQQGYNPTSTILDSLNVLTLRESDKDDGDRQLSENTCEFLKGLINIYQSPSHSAMSSFWRTKLLKEIIEKFANDHGIQYQDPGTQEWKMLSEILQLEMSSDDTNDPRLLRPANRDTSEVDKKLDVVQKASYLKYIASHEDVCNVIVFDDKTLILDAMGCDQHHGKNTRVHVDYTHNTNNIKIYEGDEDANEIKSMFDHKKSDFSATEDFCFSGISAWLQQQYNGELSIVTFERIEASSIPQYRCRISQSPKTWLQWSNYQVDIMIACDADKIIITPAEDAEGSDHQKSFTQLFLNDDVRYLNDGRHTQALKAITIPIVSGSIGETTSHDVEFTQRKVEVVHSPAASALGTTYTAIPREDDDGSLQVFTLSVTHKNSEDIEIAVHPEKDLTNLSARNQFLSDRLGDKDYLTQLKFTVNQIYQSLEALNNEDDLKKIQKGLEDIKAQYSPQFILLEKRLYQELSELQSEGYIPSGDNGTNLFEKVLCQDVSITLRNRSQKKYDSLEEYLRDEQDGLEKAKPGSYYKEMPTIDVLKELSQSHYLGKLEEDTEQDYENWSALSRDFQIERLVEMVRTPQGTYDSSNNDFKALQYLVLVTDLHQHVSSFFRSELVSRIGHCKDSSYASVGDYRNTYDQQGARFDIFNARMNALRSPYDQFAPRGAVKITVGRNSLKESYNNPLTLQQEKYWTTTRIACTVGLALLSIAVIGVAAGVVAATHGAALPLIPAVIGFFSSVTTIGVTAGIGGLLAGVMGYQMFPKKSKQASKISSKEILSKPGSKKKTQGVNLHECSQVRLKYLFFGKASDSTEEIRDFIKNDHDLFSKVCQSMDEEVSVDKNFLECDFIDHPQSILPCSLIDKGNSSVSGGYNAINPSDFTIEPVEFARFFYEQLTSSKDGTAENINIMCQSDLVKKEMVLFLLASFQKPCAFSPTNKKIANAILNSDYLEQLIDLDGHNEYLMQASLWMQNIQQIDNPLFRAVKTKLNVENEQLGYDLANYSNHLPEYVLRQVLTHESMALGDHLPCHQKYVYLISELLSSDSFDQSQRPQGITAADQALSLHAVLIHQQNNPDVRLNSTAVFEILAVCQTATPEAIAHSDDLAELTLKALWSGKLDLYTDKENRLESLFSFMSDSTLSTRVSKALNDYASTNNITLNYTLMCQSLAGIKDISGKDAFHETCARLLASMFSKDNATLTSPDGWFETFDFSQPLMDNSNSKKPWQWVIDTFLSGQTTSEVFDALITNDQILLAVNDPQKWQFSNSFVGKLGGWLASHDLNKDNPFAKYSETIQSQLAILLSDPTLQSLLADLGDEHVKQFMKKAQEVEIRTGGAVSSMGMFGKKVPLGQKREIVAYPALTSPLLDPTN